MAFLRTCFLELPELLFKKEARQSTEKKRKCENIVLLLSKLKKNIL